MWDFLDKLREKNDAQKLVISFVFALIITFVIVVTWLTVVFSTKDTKEVKKEVEIKRADEVTPLSNLGEQVNEIKSLFGDLMAQFNSSEEGVYELPLIEEDLTKVSSTTSSTTIDIENNSNNSTTTLEIESSVE